MKGCAHAAKRDLELAVTTAWHTELFARAKKLKNLREYLPREDGEEPPPPVQPEIILDAMLTMQASGVEMQVRKID